MKRQTGLVEFDEARAREVFALIEKDWLGKVGIFADVVLPDERIKNLPSDHRRAANFLFFASITMRGAVVSDDPVRWLDRLSKENPDIFQPEEVVRHWDEDGICRLFGSVTANLLGEKGLPAGSGHMGPKYKEFARSWLRNAENLHRYWKDSVLEIFAEVEDFEQAFLQVDYRVVGKEVGFIGMRRKIFSLLTVWLQSSKLIPVFPTPLPVDFHALRVLLGTGVVTVALKPLLANGRPLMDVWQGAPNFRVSERITDEIALWSQAFIQKEGFSHLCLNPAIWVLSRVLCVAHYQNRCIGRVVPQAPEPCRLAPKDWPAGYLDPCQFCPAEDYCQKVVPAGPYYRWGLIIPLARVPYELPRQEFLPGLDPGFTGRHRSRI